MGPRRPVPVGTTDEISPTVSVGIETATREITGPAKPLNAETASLEGMGGPKILGEILLVDDNPGDVRLIEETIEEADFDPDLYTVSDGTEALAFLRREGEYADAPDPDVVLLDLHLAKMDGDELLERVDGEISDVSVVAISGSEEIASLKLSDIEDGVAACLVKPIGVAELEEVAQSV